MKKKKSIFAFLIFLMLIFTGNPCDSQTKSVNSAGNLTMNQEPQDSGIVCIPADSLRKILESQVDGRYGLQMAISFQDQLKNETSEKTQLKIQLEATLDQNEKMKIALIEKPQYIKEIDWGWVIGGFGVGIGAAAAVYLFLIQ